MALKLQPHNNLIMQLVLVFLTRSDGKLKLDKYLLISFDAPS